MLKNINLFKFFIAVFCIIQITAFGKETIIFGTFPIPGLVIDKDHGALIELTKEIARKENLDIKIVVKPRKRIFNEFTEGKIDVFFPALDVDFPNPEQIIKADEPVGIKEDFVFTRKGEALLKTIKDLEGKQVGLTRGYPYSKELTENSLINFDLAQSDETNILKLLSKRIDAFIITEIAGLKAFKEKGVMDRVQYDSENPVAKLGSYYAFQNNKQNKKLAESISNLLIEMKKDGTYAKYIHIEK